MCEKEIDCASHSLQCGICWPQGTYDVFQRWGKGGVEVKQARLWEHSNISLSLLRDKTFKGESVRAYEKSQLINLLATVPRHIHRQIKNKNTNWSKCPSRFTNCLTLLCSSYILESVCNRKRYYKKSHLIYRLAICSGWKPGAGSPLYPCGPANTPLGSTQRPKSVRLNSCLPPNPSSPPRESNIWL